MELPEDILETVRAYAKPTEPFKLYQRILKVLQDDIRAEDVPKLKMAIRYHYDRFLPMFQQLENAHAELRISVDAVMRNDTTMFTVAELRMEYYRKRQNYTWKRCNAMNEIYRLWSLSNTRQIV